jgi:hypothetical protein
MGRSKGSQGQPTDTLLAIYQHGQQHRDASLMALAYADDRVSSWWEHPVLSLFWHAGYEGESIPRWVTAERYGDIPLGGRSRNHAENCAEHGLSVARLIDDDDDYEWHSGIFGGDQRPVVRVAGWLHYRRGGDGEPLLVAPEIRRELK